MIVANENSCLVGEVYKKNAEEFGYFAEKVYLCIRFSEKTVKHRGVAQLVAHLVWDQVVARSSRVTPTFQRKRSLVKKRIY